MPLLQELDKAISVAMAAANLCVQSRLHALTSCNFVHQAVDCIALNTDLWT